MIRIDGLTEHQKMLLDTMWELNTSEELYTWMETITEENLRTVTVLIDMIQLAYIDKDVHCNTDLSNVYDMIMACRAK
jgi:hypothetical protein